MKSKHSELRVQDRGRRRINQSAFVFVLLAFCALNTEGSSKFGFNYWPAGYSCDVLTNANWTVANRNTVQSQLDQMSSLGADVIRFMFWPQKSGWALQHGGGPGGATFTTDFSEELNNLPTLLGYCSSRGIKVIICFGNNYYDLGNGTPGHRYWMDFYGNNDDGFHDFLNDTKYWINGFVNAIQGPYASTILYYDYENEFSRSDPNNGWYIGFLYDWITNIPVGKRGCSVAQVDSTSPYSGDDVQDLKDSLPGRPLDFVDYHVYPPSGNNTNVEACYDSVKNRFSNATVLLGEFGRESAGSEANQQTTVVDVGTRARNKNIPYNLHWMFLDNAINTNTFGWGYSTHNPKHVMGGMSTLNNIIYNPDAEIVTAGQPAGWSAGSSGSVSLYSMGPSTGDAAANSYYARLQCNTPSAAVWLNAQTLVVSGGQKMFVNCFFRSNMTNIRIRISEYNSTWGSLASSTAPGYDPSGWSWNNYLGRVGPWSIQLNANTHYVIVSVLGTNTTGPVGYLDVDVASAHTR
jgi:hypothetical protein